MNKKAGGTKGPTKALVVQTRIEMVVFKVVFVF